jgi:putative endonuclease
MFTTYVLLSKSTGRFYTGSTSDLQARLESHNSNLSAATKNGGPWELVHREEFETRTEAMARERYFKTGVGREELKRMLSARSSIG